MSINPINKEIHKNIKIKPNSNFKQSEHSHIVPLTIHEFARAGQEFPIVFVKDQDSGQFHPVALLGLKPGENLFFKRGAWTAGYVPEVLRAYPFLALREKEDSDRLIVCIDESSELVSESEGEALFDESGSETRFVLGKGEFVAELLEKNRVTRLFVEYLTERELLAPQALSLDSKIEESYDITGLYAVDEPRLNDLSDKEFAELRQRGYLVPIYASLLSMHRVNYLMPRVTGS